MKNTSAFFIYLLVFLFSLGCNTADQSVDNVPVLSIEESIKDFEIENGFIVESVCTEPLIEDPVAVCFDEDAAMWVIEMRGYMHDKEGAGEDLPLGRIKVIRDNDEDGNYETASIFLDSLILPRAIAIVQGGILLIEPPALYFVENNNGKAGKKTVIDSAFAETGNVEHQPNGLLLGMDNWYYCSTSDKRIKKINNNWIIEKTQWRGQWGISKDDAGRLYYNNNSVMLMTDNFFPGSFPVNENYRTSSGKVSGVQIADNKVFPGRQTTVNRGYQKGVLDATGKLVDATSVCGPVIYRGDNFPKEYYGNAFIMEPAAFLIKRILLKDDENGFTKGSFAYADKEFLTASDERFRPVNSFNGPDGCLYVVDMHRGIIQHTTYITPYLRQHIDSLKLERPINMGRIYRIRWKEKAASKPLKIKNYSSVQLVDLLKQPNGHYRDMAHRLLVERNDTSIAASLRSIVYSKANPIISLNALWILEGLNMISPDFLTEVAGQTTDNRIYQSCLLLFRKFSEQRSALDKLIALYKKNDRISDIYFINSLSAFYKNHFSIVEPFILNFASAYKNDSLIADVLLSGLQGREELFSNKFKNLNVDTVLSKALAKAIATSKKPKVEDNIVHLNKKEKQLFAEGKRLYITYCVACHGKEGEGMLNIAPPLAASEWINTDNHEIPARIILDGMSGPVTVNGVLYSTPSYSNAMPGLRDNIETNNGVIAGVLTYIRNSFGNKNSAVSAEEVGKIRAATKEKKQPYTEEELKKINLIRISD